MRSSKQTLLIAATVVTALLSAGSARAQQLARPELIVQVGDQSTGRPLANAAVIIVGEAASLTDSAGVARLAGVPAGTYTVSFAALGYARKDFQVIFDATGVIRTAVWLSPEPLKLSPLQVRGESSERHDRYLAGTGFYLRERMGGGTYIWGKELEKIAERTSDIAKAFDQVPGFRVVYKNGRAIGVVSARGIVGISHSCSPTVYIDGLRGELWQIAELMNVDAIEAYPGAGFAPVEYRAGTCGTILIWTKH